MDPMDSMRAGPTHVPKDFNAEDAQNMEDIEKQFAVKAVEHMETFSKLLELRRGKELRLTGIDDEIYKHFRETFPDLDVSKELNEDEMKSKGGKEIWRKFMMAYEKKVKDYNFGTMLRTKPNEDYAQDNAIFVPRMQFYAIEIARNQEWQNDWVYIRAHPEKKEEIEALIAKEKEEAKKAQ